MGYSDKETAPPASQLVPKRKLTLVDAIGSTLAQMAPAAAIYYGLPVIFIATGIGSPLTLLLSAVAIIIVGLSLTRFSAKHPSSGSMIKYIGMSFGGVTGTASSIVFIAGTVFLAASAFIELGGWTADSLALYGIHIHWAIPTVVLGVLIWGLTVIGIDRSTKIASIALIIEVLVLLGVTIYILLDPPNGLSAKPFVPSSVTDGLAGIGLGFPLAIYLFIGFENSAALAEETQNPKRNTKRAVLISIAIMTVFYLLVSYAVIAGFGNNNEELVASSNPFMVLADRYLGDFSFLAVIAGFTSIVGMTIACLNGFSRVAFNSAREGLIPSKISLVSKWQTPASALSLLSGLGIVFALLFGFAGDTWVTGFGYLGTIGTIPLLLIYALLNIAVMVYPNDDLNFFQRYVLPALGVISIALPIWAMIQPGQPKPVSFFPWIIFGIVVISLIYAWLKIKRDPSLPSRIGAAAAEPAGEYEANASSL
ncbi:APC family permease [Paenibacillus protaetiae]|uniref:APC family permease n=1 Tax=Paenibacillus protaetiae TaxID=2509456 RepID=A0A4P6EXB5_9BACL|nr:APC family permease [Paenibacillus protaetiae]QAY65247.1 APC family permease [Paenibacillus protaetiae]